MKSLETLPNHRIRPLAFTTTLAVAALSLVLSSPAVHEPRANDAGSDHGRLAQGILVQPDAGALEPPAVRDSDESDGDDDDAGEAAPPVVIEPGIVIPEGGAEIPASRQEELERPGGRQVETERGDAGQEDIEMPDGPGQKY